MSNEKVIPIRCFFSNGSVNFNVFNEQHLNEFYADYNQRKIKGFSKGQWVVFCFEAQEKLFDIVSSGLVSKKNSSLENLSFKLKESGLEIVCSNTTSLHMWKSSKIDEEKFKEYKKKCKKTQFLIPQVMLPKKIDSHLYICYNLSNDNIVVFSKTYFEEKKLDNVMFPNYEFVLENKSDTRCFIGSKLFLTSLKKFKGLCSIDTTHRAIKMKVSDKLELSVNHTDCDGFHVQGSGELPITSEFGEIEVDFNRDYLEKIISLCQKSNPSIEMNFSSNGINQFYAGDFTAALSALRI